MVYIGFNMQIYLVCFISDEWQNLLVGYKFSLELLHLCLVHLLVKGNKIGPFCIHFCDYKGRCHSSSSYNSRREVTSTFFVRGVLRPHYWQFDPSADYVKLAYR